MKSEHIHDMYHIEMSESEAIVLYEFLYQNVKNLTYSHYSEKKVLLQLQGVIESKLKVIFSDDFTQQLENARVEVQGRDEVEDKYWKQNT